MAPRPTKPIAGLDIVNDGLSEAIQRKVRSTKVVFRPRRGGGAVIYLGKVARGMIGTSPIAGNAEFRRVNRRLIFYDLVGCSCRLPDGENDAVGYAEIENMSGREPARQTRPQNKEMFKNLPT